MRVCVGTYKAQRRLRFCMGTNGKRKGNTAAALEPMENARRRRFCVGTYENNMKTKLLFRKNILKTYGQLRFCMGTHGKHKESVGFEWKHIENARKTHLLCGDRWKTQGKRRFCIGTYEKHTKH